MSDRYPRIAAGIPQFGIRGGRWVDRRPMDRVPPGGTPKKKPTDPPFAGRSAGKKWCRRGGIEARAKIEATSQCLPTSPRGGMLSDAEVGPGFGFVGSITKLSDTFYVKSNRRDVTRSIEINRRRPHDSCAGGQGSLGPASPCRLPWVSRAPWGPRQTAHRS